MTSNLNVTNLVLGCSEDKTGFGLPASVLVRILYVLKLWFLSKSTDAIKELNISRSDHAAHLSASGNLLHTKRKIKWCVFASHSAKVCFIFYLMSVCIKPVDTFA